VRPTRSRIALALAVVAVFAALAVWKVPRARSLAAGVYRRLRGRHTVAQRMAQYGPAARARWAPWFARAGLTYPPQGLTLVALKDAAELVVYGRDASGAWHRIRRLPVVALSGGPGPKLREGDRQVPEGLYRIESLNPDSLYHLAMRVNYPSPDDRLRAREDGRTQLGGDIMIHGSDGSVGCLAMGDEGIEDLFVLAVDVGHERVRLVFAPTDLRRDPTRAPPPGAPPWVAARYTRLREALAVLP
jgi:hypothetical protein